jgi:hypothetical protein
VAQTGGQFTIEQSVIANGGGTSSGGVFSVAGTNTQSVAGTLSTSVQFGIHGGFWQGAPPISPTAATVSVSGRIVTADGRGIRMVKVTMFRSDGTSQTALSSSFGYYNFDDVLAGQNIVITASAKRYAFQQPTVIVYVGDNLSDINFVAY